MTTLSKLSLYLNEKYKFEIGDYIKQKGSDYEAYGVIISHLKNGSCKAKVFMSYDGSTAGKAKQKSIKGWFPEPKKINKEEIPDKILKKLQ